MRDNGRSVTRKLIDAHLIAGKARVGEEIGLHIDQTLTQDATGTLVMLMLEALGLDSVRTEVSAQYVDHNLLQQDYRNADDHQFLYSACQRFGVHFSRPGNGISHPLHMQHFGRPGITLLGSDSHTCAAGSMGMLAIGAGGMDVALAMAGEPYYLPMPEIWGIELEGELPPWVSAKDVILEMLRRHGVDGGVGRVIEYRGSGVAGLTAMDRHVIANMGAELGATSTVFPSDQQTRHFLARCGRKSEWAELSADRDAHYDDWDRIDLSELEPLIALPSSPGNVVPVSEVAGAPIYQAYVGSSANPGFRDFAIVARIVAGRTVPANVSLDINPSTRELLGELARAGLLADLLGAGARIHQPGCNGCIGMGQAPASGRNSLRTVPRNFPGRSGAREDSVFLCSPETAAASALRGTITDPRELGAPPRLHWDSPIDPPEPLVPPPAIEDRSEIALVKGPNIASLDVPAPLPDILQVPVLLVVGDDISTDEILPAGAQVLALRSNVPAISAFLFHAVDESYASAARAVPAHAIVAGRNYGQGSSREHAALAPRFLGLTLVLARSYARIHRQNLINAGVLPLLFDSDGDAWSRLSRGNTLTLTGIHALLDSSESARARIVVDDDWSFELGVELSPRERAIVRAGGVLGWFRTKRR